MKSFIILIALTIITISATAKNYTPEKTKGTKNLKQEQTNLEKSKKAYSYITCYEYRPITKRTFYLENKKTFKSYSSFLKLDTIPACEGYKVINNKFYKAFIIVK